MTNPVLAKMLLPTLLVVGCTRKPNSNVNVDLERRFQTMMSGVTLVGHSTSLNQEGISSEERYVIDNVSKLTGDTWLLHARLQYNSHDIPVPVPVSIKWAGDTPVIMLTDLTLPGLGTYTARILFYGDQYAGTWSSKDHGGQLFGKIVRSP